MVGLSNARLHFQHAASFVASCLPKARRVYAPIPQCFEPVFVEKRRFSSQVPLPPGPWQVRKARLVRPPRQTVSTAVLLKRFYSATSFCDGYTSSKRVGCDDLLQHSHTPQGFLRIFSPNKCEHPPDRRSVQIPHRSRFQSCRGAW